MFSQIIGKVFDEKMSFMNFFQSESLRRKTKFILITAMLYDNNFSKL